MLVETYKPIAHSVLQATATWIAASHLCALAQEVSPNWLKEFTGNPMFEQAEMEVSKNIFFPPGRNGADAEGSSVVSITCGMGINGYRAVP